VYGNKTPHQFFNDDADDDYRASNEGITEEAVRRYLMRKPMTTKDLVQKFKSRNAGMTKEQMTTTIVQILKRINPQKTKINDKLYLSIKKDS